MIPLTVNPPPLAVTVVTVSLTVPEFVTVTLCFALLPTPTEPKDTLAGVTLNDEVVVPPVPARGMISGELAASLARETEPEEAAPEVGAKATSKEVDWPGWMVNGATSPDALKPPPVMANCEIVKLVFPEFEMVIACDLLWPTVTVPKVRLAGLALIRASVPVPLSATLAVGVELFACAAIKTLPAALPLAVGAN